MNIESLLFKEIGITAGKLHTARSRNDQVVTDFKLWIKNNSKSLDKNIQQLQKNLINLSKKHLNTVLPGYTHLQIAQPISLAHHCLAYVEMFGRDRTRLNDCLNRLNENPLGSAALAGTSFPIDRNLTSKLLGFKKPTVNALDSVSDRDFAVEFIFVLSLLSLHLSRMAEEIIFWANSQFNFIQLPDEFARGSCILPQKKNPDFAEIIKSKASLAHGMLSGLLSIQKGAMSGYNRDTQTSKYLIMDLIRECESAPLILKGVFESLTVNHKKMKKLSETDFMNATDIADHLTRKLNLPFRECYHLTAKSVKLSAPELKITNEALRKTLEEIGQPAEIADDMNNMQEPLKLIEQRLHHGSPSPEQTRLQVKEFTNQLNSLSAPLVNMGNKINDAQENCRNYEVRQV